MSVIRKVLHDTAETLMEHACSKLKLLAAGAGASSRKPPCGSGICRYHTAAVTCNAGTHATLYLVISSAVQGKFVRPPSL